MFSSNGQTYIWSPASNTPSQTVNSGTENDMQNKNNSIGALLAFFVTTKKCASELIIESKLDITL